MATHNCCQSCGLALARDPQGGGTYSDGTKSNSYCSRCYAGGRFTQPDLTVEQMRQRRVEELRARGYPRFFARLMVRSLHKLERWNVGDRPLAHR